MYICRQLSWWQRVKRNIEWTLHPEHRAEYERQQKAIVREMCTGSNAYAPIAFMDSRGSVQDVVYPPSPFSGLFR